MLFLVGCNSAPEPVIFGSELCDHCKMSIHDHRYGSEILTKKGKSYKFDSLECMLDFEAKKLDKNEIVQSRYVFNTFKKGELIPLEQATFLIVPNLRSPMGLGVWASDSAEQMTKAKNEHGGEILNWEKLKIRLQSR